MKQIKILLPPPSPRFSRPFQSKNVYSSRFERESRSLCLENINNNLYNAPIITVVVRIFSFGVFLNFCQRSFEIVRNSTWLASREKGEWREFCSFSTSRESNCTLYAWFPADNSRSCLKLELQRILTTLSLEREIIPLFSTVLSDLLWHVLLSNFSG